MLRGRRAGEETKKGFSLKGDDWQIATIQRKEPTSASIWSSFPSNSPLPSPHMYEHHGHKTAEIINPETCLRPMSNLHQLPSPGCSHNHRWPLELIQIRGFSSTETSYLDDSSQATFRETRRFEVPRGERHLCQPVPGCERA